MACVVKTLKCIVNLQNSFQKKKGVYEVVLVNAKRYSKANYRLVKRPVIRNQANIMKLDSPQFQSCITDEVKYLFNLFSENGHEIRIVGGAVRDLLMGIQPEDLDFATTATPAEMKKIFTENNIRLLNTNGEKHGTITSRINEKNFEVTTLRVDLSTNGRHAEVEFTKDWILDANRRDLTINAMYLALDGTVYDYFNGCEDLKNKRIVFVGDAATRIQEDYLRILRYFRFYGRIADTPDRHDEDMLKAIRENAEGLMGISGERIWMEMSKILSGKFVDHIILKMINLGIGSYIGFPKEPNITEFKTVVDRLKMKDMPAKPVTLLVGLFHYENELNDFLMRIKASNADRDLAYLIIRNRDESVKFSSIRAYQILLFTTQRHFVNELLKYQGKFDFLEELEKWQTPIFPVKGTMLKSFGIQGRDVGEVLRYLKEIWYNHNFDISAEKLLECVPKKKIKVN